MSTTPRFFVPREAIAGDSATLPPDVAHHARTVLRLRPGEALILHDGEGFAYEATLPEGKSAVVPIHRRFALNTEPLCRIVVAQALPKTGDKIEQILQHGTEVGAAGFVVFPSERSVGRLESSDKIDKRLERWREIVKNAAAQSRRGILPTVEWEPRLSGILSRLPQFDLSLILHESAPASLSASLTPKNSPASVLVAVGPEGGFSENEVAQFAAAGGRPTLLGPRILRTETAALVALAQLLYAFEPHTAPIAPSQ